jgi:hypothetical protein
MRVCHSTTRAEKAESGGKVPAPTNRRKGERKVGEWDDPQSTINH